MSIDHSTARRLFSAVEVSQGNRVKTVANRTALRSWALIDAKRVSVPSNIESSTTQLPRSRGSRMSRSPSPRKLNPRTTIMMARPGKMAIHGEISM